MELALVVTLKRVGEWKSKENVVKVDPNPKQSTGKAIMAFLDRIDFFALALYFILYILLNCVYWIRNS